MSSTLHGTYAGHWSPTPKKPYHRLKLRNCTVDGVATPRQYVRIEHEAFLAAIQRDGGFVTSANDGPAFTCVGEVASHYLYSFDCARLTIHGGDHG